MDDRAAYDSCLGEISGGQKTVTEEGIRAWSNAIRKEGRTTASFGQRRSEYSTHSLAA